MMLFLESNRGLPPDPSMRVLEVMWDIFGWKKHLTIYGSGKWPAKDYKTSGAWVYKWPHLSVWRDV